MDVPTLILLGAAGGVLRGLLDAYNRFLAWQSDRRARRQSPTGQEGEPARFQDYFDPVADPIAAVVHSALGAGAAVLLGTTGQVSGAYAAIVVGISAPVILTQLGGVQSVSDAVNGAPQPGTVADEGAAEASPPAVPPAQRPAPAGAGPQLPDTQPYMAGPTQLSPTGQAAPESIDERPRASFTGRDFASPDLDLVGRDLPGPHLGDPDLAHGLQPGAAASDPQPNGHPLDLTGGPGGAPDDHDAPLRRHGPTVGEEGTTR
ncbi:MULTISPECIES: hypothetical protein [unclassified Streptomyces]|uniref:hypothetical protein n=1 Tax=unclassified Streptomyces TaxID=2593676 RepID=UPI000A5E0565|nr:hypothetical protein [Streptomyces sp. CB02058]